MTNINNNPWKGLDSYSYSDNSIFFGRKKETETLVDTILNNRFTILYGPSGVGKSSLLNAGVRPILSKGNYFVVDVSMRQFDLKSKLSISSQILARVKECAQNEQIDITPLSKIEENSFYEDSLWYFFHTNEFWSSKNELLTPIVIVDQFEDVFKDEIRELSPEQFFHNLDELSNVVPPMSMREDLINMESFRYNQSADFRFVFSLREDYLPRLDDFVYSLNIPELRKSRYSITLLDKSQAREIILGPANGIVSDNVADKIIDILSSQTSRNRLLHKIEPFLLSLFMYRVFIEMTKRGLSTISGELINMIGADVVNDFYVESMKKVSSKAMKHLENVLLTPKGHRDSISYDKLMASEKVTDEELKTLLDARIIKKYTINSVDRYEFTHDILSKYAQKNKEKREKNNKSQLVIGYLGTFVTLLLAGLVGWIMSAFLTYISIPVLIVAAVICSYGIFNLKFTSRKRTITFLGLCGLLGIGIDLIQIIPVIGYVIYILVCLSSLYLLYMFAAKYFVKKSQVAKYSSVAFVWFLSFVIIPVLCFGYNIFKGMNYARSKQFISDTFYVKNGDGQYGIRNRDSVIVMPHFDEMLKPINCLYQKNDSTVGIAFVVKSNSKYGILDSLYRIKQKIKYDMVETDTSGNVYCYINNREIADNGIGIKWKNDTSPLQKRIVRKIVNNMVLVKGGSFIMGTDLKNVELSGYRPLNGENFLHNVSLTDYFINKFEVTIEDWIVIMGYDPRTRVSMVDADTISFSQHPVYRISYDDCCKFTKKISEMTGNSFDLPTEAQWEFAARGGVNIKPYEFSGSKYVTDVGWIGLNSKFISHPVGQLKANSLGLYDMTGNISELCKDYMDVNYYKQTNGSVNPCCNNVNNKQKNRYVVCRGGSFETTQRENYHVTRRQKAPANLEFRSTGFRLVLNPSNNHK